MEAGKAGDIGLRLEVSSCFLFSRLDSLHLFLLPPPAPPKSCSCCHDGHSRNKSAGDKDGMNREEHMSIVQGSKASKWDRGRTRVGLLIL